MKNSNDFRKIALSLVLFFSFSFCFANDKLDITLDDEPCFETIDQFENISVSNTFNGNFYSATFIIDGVEYWVTYDSNTGETNSNYDGIVIGSVDGNNDFNVVIEVPCADPQEDDVADNPTGGDDDNNGNGGDDDDNGNGGDDDDNGNGGDDDDNGNGGDDSGNGNGNNGNGGNTNGNNGHGNNEDGVDVSNPGQGGGGPNSEDDLSGSVDDENNSGNGGNGDDDNGNGDDDDDDDDDNGNGNNGNGNGNGNGNDDDNGNGNGDDDDDNGNGNGNNGNGNGDDDDNGNGNGNNGNGNGDDDDDNGNGNNGNGNGNGNGDDDDNGNGNDDDDNGNGGAPGNGTDLNNDDNIPCEAPDVALGNVSTWSTFSGTTYSFDFTVDGDSYSGTYQPNNGIVNSDYPDIEGEFNSNSAYLILTISNNCGTFTDTLYLYQANIQNGPNSPSAEEEIANFTNLNSTEVIYLNVKKINDGIVHFRLVDSNGSTHLFQEMNDGQNTVNITTIKKGIYIYQLTNNGVTYKSGKLLIR